MITKSEIEAALNQEDHQNMTSDQMERVEADKRALERQLEADPESLIGLRRFSKDAKTAFISYMGNPFASGNK